MADPIPNVSDELHDGLLIHQVDLLRVAAGQRKTVLAELEKLETQLQADLQNVVGKTPATIARLGALLKQTKGTISSAYQTIADNQGEDLEKIAQLEATKVVNVVNAALKVSVATVGQSPEQLAAIAGKTLVQGKYPAEWWKAQDKALQDKFATVMREGMLKGEGIDKLVQRVRGTAAKGYVDGIMVASKAQATALVRTSVITVANEARIASIMKQGKVVKGIQWVATLDSRTTPICQALDGKQWSVPGLKPIGHDKAFPGPTAHWQCRSTQIPVTRSWAELANKPIKTTGEGDYQAALAAKMKAAGMSDSAIAKAMGGLAKKLDGNGTSGTVTFEDWLSKKPDSEVDAILGKGKAQLWREGKITVTQMTDQDNRPLTLAELKQAVANNSGLPLPESKSPHDFAPLVEKPAPFFNPKAAAAKKAAEEATAAAAKQAELLAAEKKAQRTVQDAYGKFDPLSKAVIELNDANRGTMSAQEILDAAAQKVAAAAEKKAAKLAADTLAKAEAEAKAAKAAKDAADAAAAEAKKQADALALANQEAQAEIGTVMADPKGKTLLAKNLGKLMKDSPHLEPKDLLEQAKAAAVADQAKASQAAALSGYKKKFLAGAEPTGAQKKAFGLLSDADQQTFLKALDAAKAAAEQKAAKELADKLAAEAAAKAAADAATAQASADAAAAAAKAAPPVITTPAPAGFPADPENLKVVKKLGGSTGAELVKDSEGNLFVRKRGASPAHLREEVTADELYRAFGLDVPEAQLYTTPAGPVKLARFVQGQTLKEFLAKATAAQAEAVFAELRKGFSVDALLGNWDVLGTDLDNVLVAPGGKVWRIDNGGSLRFRAQGAPKVGTQWNEHPTDLWTLRGKKWVKGDVDPLPGNLRVFGKLDIYEIGRQIEALDVAALANAPAEVRDVLAARLATLKDIGRKALQYEGDGRGWKADAADEITRHIVGLRERGISGALPKKFTNAGTQITDENGLAWDHLRTKGAQGPASAPTPGLDPKDDVYAKLLDAVKTFNFHGPKGSTPNATKIKAALDMIADLEGKAAQFDPMAKHYLPTAKDLAEGVHDLAAGKPFTPVLKFEPWKNPVPAVIAPTVAAVRTDSLVSDLAAYIADNGGDYAAVGDWQGSQAGDSWNDIARAFKYWHYKNQDPARAGTLFWGTKGGIPEAKKQFETLAAKYGGVDKLESTLRAHAAFVQEVLGKIEFKYNDRERGLVRLIRTENDLVINLGKTLAGGKAKVGQYGEIVLQRGANESHSIFQPFGYKGTEAVAQAVPHTRVTGLYWLERRPGQGYTGSFAGDGENEFTADTSGIPGRYTQRPNVLKIDAGGDFDATKWQVPLSHVGL